MDCDECGLPVEICNAKTMVDAAVKKHGRAAVFAAIGARQVSLDDLIRPGYELASNWARESGIILPPFESVKITLTDV